MRILHVARYGSVHGGTETYLEALCDGQRARGDAVALAYGMEPDHTRPEVADGFAIPALVEPRATAPEADRRALLDAVEAFAPDVVHVHTPDVSWVAPACASVAPTLLAVHDHKLNCPTGTKYWTAWGRTCRVSPGPWCLAFNLVAHCGSLRANATLQPYRRWRRARASASPLRLQVFSAFMAGLLEGAGFDRERIGVTPYPVPPPMRPGTVDERDERPIVFASGRLTKEKGFALLIESLFSVKTPVHLVIAGQGHERAALEEQAVKGPRGHRVTFPGWVSPGTLAAWQERAAIVAVPSAWPEPFGIAGLEAMARARPVVAFDVGGVSEWLADGETGRLVRAGDARAFGRTLQDLLDHPEERRRMGQAGSARASGEFSLVGHLERLHALYESVRRDREQVA